jgi:N-acetyl-gamma-glutamyl-phosphate reductase
MAQGMKVKIIDTSTAHRTDPAWVYGMPELAGQTEKLLASSRIANPGCHASGFVALIAPLVANGIVPADAALSCFSLTGYSGGGKSMIADYENPDRSPLLGAPRQYALTQNHKHLKEMVQLSGLTTAPVFCPIVGDFYSGMEVTVPLFARDIKGNLADIKVIYQSYYQGGLIRFADQADADGMLSAAAYSFRDDMEVSVHGNEDRLLLVARFDNLGKGASGAAIQNMNLLLGLDQATGLNV